MSLPQRRRLWNFFESIFHHEITEEGACLAPQPAWIQTPLLNHQRASLHAALDLEGFKTGRDVGPVPGDPIGGKFNTMYGILGDRVGSGKSLIALSLVKQPPPAHETVEFVWRPNSYVGDNTMGLMRPRVPYLEWGNMLRDTPTALFIIPHALMNQWREYVKHDTRDLRVHFVQRRTDATEELTAQIREGTLDAVFVSSTMWRTFEEVTESTQFVWSRVFIDEADSVSVSLRWGAIHARFFWLITGSWLNLIYSEGATLNMDQLEPLPDETPVHVQNAIQKYLTGPQLFVDGVHNAFIKRLCGNLTAFHYNMSNINAIVYQMSRILIRCNADFIQKSFVTIPHIQHRRILCLTPGNIRVLQNIISPEMMERLHAGDAGGALEMLGMTARSADQIVAAVSENLEKELAGIRRLYDFKATVEYSSEAAKAKALESLEERMARIQSRMDAIQSRLRAPTEQTCPICFGDVQVPAMTPCCRNLFCFGCACEAFKRSNVCPMCREPLASIQDLQVMTTAAPAGDAEAALPKTQLLTKDAEFRRFVLENPTARILVFSSYDATFGALSGVLEDEGVSHAILQGSNSRITRLIRDFADNKYRVLFLNSRNMGAGLNIPAATHILLYHHMAVEMQNQIIGRAMRLGRTADLQVVHLLHGNEMVGTEQEDN